MQTTSEIIEELRKKYGRGSVFLLSGSTIVNVESVSTGSIGLNAALGVGGYPRGRIIEILGNPSSGKTTLTLHAIAEMQKRKLACLFIDAEHSLDAIYAHAIGVNLDELVVCQPDNAEQALDIVVDSVRSGVFGLIVIDSVAALSPIKEIDGESGDAHVGLLARLMSQNMRRISGIASKTKTTVMYVNQYRSMIGMQGYGGPSKTTPGGRALEFYATIRLDTQRIQTIGSGNESTANRTRVVVKKNKVAPPYRQTEFDIIFGHGISTEGEIVDACLLSGRIIKAGSWYKNSDGTSICQGKEKLVELMRADKTLFDALSASVDNSLLSSYCGSVNDEL